MQLWSIAVFLTPSALTGTKSPLLLRLKHLAGRLDATELVQLIVIWSLLSHRLVKSNRGLLIHRIPKSSSFDFAGDVDVVRCGLNIQFYAERFCVCIQR